MRIRRGFCGGFVVRWNDGGRLILANDRLKLVYTGGHQRLKMTQEPLGRIHRFGHHRLSLGQQVVHQRLSLGQLVVKAVESFRD